MQHTRIMFYIVVCTFMYPNIVLAMHCLIPLTNRSVPLLRATALRGYCNTNSKKITLGEALIKSEQTRLARKKFVQERDLLNKFLTTQELEAGEWLCGIGKLNI